VFEEEQVALPAENVPSSQSMTKKRSKKNQILLGKTTKKHYGGMIIRKKSGCYCQFRTAEQHCTQAKEKKKKQFKMGTTKRRISKTSNSKRIAGTTLWAK